MTNTVAQAREFFHYSWFKMRVHCAYRPRTILPTCKGVHSTIEQANACEQESVNYPRPPVRTVPRVPQLDPSWFDLESIKEDYIKEYGWRSWITDTEGWDEDY